MGVKVVEEDMVRFIQQLEGRVAAEVHTKHKLLSTWTRTKPRTKPRSG